MKEGEPELGGLQVPHTDVSSSVPNPDSQPVASATPQITQSPQPIEPTKPITPQPQPQIQPSQFSDQLISQTFASNNTTAFNNPISQPPQPQFRQSPQLQPTPQPFPTQPTPYSASDVVLPNSAPKSQKPKKGLIITIVIILLLVAIGVGVYFFMQNGGNIINNNSNTYTLLNRYSNYLLYGVESDEPIAEDATWSSETIKENLANPDEEAKANYFNTLVSLFDNFSQSYHNNQSLQESFDEEKSIIATGLIDNNTTVINSLNIFSKTPDVSVESMTDIYLKEGKEYLINYITNVYSNFIDRNLSPSIIKYGEAKSGLAIAVSELYNEYSDFGCVSTALITSCIDEITPTETIISNQTLITNYIAAIDENITYILEDPVDISRTLYNFFNMTKEEYETK